MARTRTTNIKGESEVKTQPEIKTEPVNEVKAEVKTPLQLAPRWRKIGGGSFRMPNRIIKPGQIFRAWPDEIPKAFRDVCQPVDGDVIFEFDKKGKTPIPGLKAKFTLFPKGNDLFDVVNAQGKVLNDSPLPKSVAEGLIRDLER